LQNEAPDLTPSESCQSSDEDSDVGATFNLENHASMLELVATSHADTASSPASSQVPLIEHLEITVNNIIVVKRKVQSLIIHEIHEKSFT